MVLKHFNKKIVNRDSTYISILKAGVSIWDRDTYWKSYVWEGSPLIKRKRFPDETLKEREIKM